MWCVIQSHCCVVCVACVFFKVWRECAVQMMNRYRLRQHCFSIKQYIMLSAGDFIQHLMDIVSPELEKRADRIFAHHMAGFIQQALRASNAQHDDEDTLGRLSAHVLTVRPYLSFSLLYALSLRSLSLSLSLRSLLFLCSLVCMRSLSRSAQKSHGETGWDVFSLDYRVEQPISVVLHSHAMRTGYYRMFHFLWRLKRVDHVLGRAWQAHLSDHMHRLDHLPKFKGAPLRCSLYPPRLFPLRALNLDPLSLSRSLSLRRRDLSHEQHASFRDGALCAEFAELHHVRSAGEQARRPSPLYLSLYLSLSLSLLCAALD